MSTYDPRDIYGNSAQAGGLWISTTTTSSSTVAPNMNSLQWIGGQGGGGMGGIAGGAGGLGQLGQIIGPGYLPQAQPNPGRDFRHKTYYSGIVEMVIALAAEEGADGRIHRGEIEDGGDGPEEFMECVVRLSRDSESIDLDFGTLCEIAADGAIESLAQLIQVTVGMLPRAMPQHTAQTEQERWMQQLAMAQVAASSYSQSMLSNLLGNQTPIAIAGTSTNPFQTALTDAEKSAEKRSTLDQLKAFIGIKK